MRKSTGRPSMAAMKRHADKFGTHCVLDAAIDVGYPKESLCDLLAALDAIEAKQYADKKERKRLGIIGVLPSRRANISDRVDKAIRENALYATGARS